jgi:hypothetical protein
VAKRRGAEDKTADSVRTLQLMQLIAVNAAKQAEDSVQTIAPDNNSNTADSSMIQQSIQRDDNNFETSNADIDKPKAPPVTAAPPVPVINSTPVVIPKPVVAKPVVSKPLPEKKPVVANPVSAKPVIKSNNAAAPKKPSAKPIPKPKPNVVKPKVVMPPKNDYKPIP